MSDLCPIVYSMSDWKTLEEAAVLLGTSERAVKYLVAQRKVQSQLIPVSGKKPKRFIPLADIERIKSERNGTSPAVVVSDMSDMVPANGQPADTGVRLSPEEGFRLPSLYDLTELANKFAGFLAHGRVPLELAEDQWGRLERILNAPRPSMDVLRPDEAAIYCKRSVGVLRRLREKGRLTNIGSAGRILYSREELDKLSRIGQET